MMLRFGFLMKDTVSISLGLLQKELKSVCVSVCV